MGSYKANNNQNKSNEAKMVDAAAEFAKKTPNIYAKAGGEIVSGLNKITGGKSSEFIGNAMKNVVNNNPAFNTIQNATNKLNKKNSEKQETDNAEEKSNNKTSSLNTKTALHFGNNKNDNNKENDIGKKVWNGIPKPLKIKIIVGAGGFLLFLMMVYAVMAQDDLYNLMLTNNTDISSTGSSNRKCTSEEIQDKLVYVGDSRLSGLESQIENENTSYIIGTNDGYDWLNNTALSEIEKKLEEEPKSIIVLGLGINDLSNIDDYISVYKNLIYEYPNNIYILSVNPVDETKVTLNGNNVTNSEIEEFNKKLSNNFPNNYIDTYSGLSNINTTDGIYYDNDTYNSLNTYITNNISNSGKVLCADLNSGSYLGDVSTCALTVKDGVYYKTVVPATASCNVSKFTTNMWGLEPSFYANIIALIEEAKSIGCNASIISGHRTYAAQNSLYQKYRVSDPGRAARPGYSNHEYGIAADLRYSPKTSTCLSYYHNNAKKYGLHFPLLYASRPEDWHIEPVNIIKGTP